jgi:hypothetical protein
MYYVTPKAGERFYLRLLLNSVKGATSFAKLRTFQEAEMLNFRQACLARGLLTDDNEWHQCLTEGAQMATGYQLRLLFVTILRECSPSDPVNLWHLHRVHICDDLHHYLTSHNIRADPTQVC